MKRDASGFGNLSVLLLTVAIVALTVICLASTTPASALTPQGGGGRVQPTPTPKKTTPLKKPATPARTNRTNASKPSARKSQPEAAKTTAAEIAFWETIKTSTNPDDFREYLKKYPEGEFAGLAKNRLNTLEAAAKAEAAKKEEAAERSHWESIKDSNKLEDFRVYLEKYPNGQFAQLAKNRITSLNEAQAKASTANAAPKPAAGAWVVPEIKGDSNCLDEPCKAIRRIVAAAPTNFKPILGNENKDEGYFYADAFPPDFFMPQCRVVPERGGLAPTFYHCPYSVLSDLDRADTTAFRKGYEKNLAALGRALPGWFFESQKVYVLDKTWEIVMAGPKECTLQTCPVKLLLHDAKWPDGVLNFEVEAPHDKPEEMLSESFKKQFLEDIDAMFAAAASDFRTVSAKEQSFARHGFWCLDPNYTDGHRGRFCVIKALPMGRAEKLFELAKQAIRKHKPDWKVVDERSNFFKTAPPAICQNVYDCGGARANWQVDNDGFTFYFNIENPPAKRN